MFSHTSLGSDGTLLVHQSVISESTKAFQRGTVIVTATEISFAKLPAIPLPAGFEPQNGMTIQLQLVGPDGARRKQVRSITLTERLNSPGTFSAAGQAKTPRAYSKEDGWGLANYKFRAYFTHPGINTDGRIPAWLQASIDRQTQYWNRLAYLCRQARRACSDVPVDEIKAFVNETVLPAIDAFNNLLGKSKLKMKHPRKLKVENPTLSGIWKFLGELRHRVEEEMPVPAGLLDQVLAYAEQHKADYTPLNKFLKDFNTTAKTEAEALHLKFWESKPVHTAFASLLARRKTQNAAFTDAWPLIKYPDRRGARDWTLHYNFNKAGIPASDLDSARGVPGLRFGPPLDPAQTGHPEMSGLASERKMREAHISIAGEGRERWEFHFAVLQHRALPGDGHIKEWKLLFSDGRLWLCLVIELMRPLAEESPVAAGLDIGWRKLGDGIRFGMLYEPNGKTFRELRVNLLKSPPNHADRAPFQLDLGPNQWERRNMKLIHPNWQPGDPPLTAIQTRAALTSRRAGMQQEAKRKLMEYFGDKAPAWLEKIGRKGLLKMLLDPATDPGAAAIITAWTREDEAFDAIVRQRSQDFGSLSDYFKHITRRVEYGQYQIAHDVCRHLQQAGVSLLIIEENFLAKAAQNQSNLDSDSLKNSQKYRQLVASAKFVSIMRNIAEKYAITVEAKPAFNTSRVCHHCGHLNSGTDLLHFTCAGCGKQVDQDQNAAVNLSRAGSVAPAAAA